MTSGEVLPQALGEDGVGEGYPFVPAGTGENNRLVCMTSQCCVLDETFYFRTPATRDLSSS